MSQLILCLCILDNEILSYKSNDCKVWSHINIKGEAGYHHQSNIDNFNMVLGECNLSLNLDDELKDVHFCVVYKQQYAHFALALIKNAKEKYKNELFSCYPLEQVYKCYSTFNVGQNVLELDNLTYEWIASHLLPVLSFDSSYRVHGGIAEPVQEVIKPSIEPNAFFRGIDMTNFEEYDRFDLSRFFPSYLPEDPDKRLEAMKRLEQERIEQCKQVIESFLAKKTIDEETQEELIEKLDIGSAMFDLVPSVNDLALSASSVFELLNTNINDVNKKAFLITVEHSGVACKECPIPVTLNRVSNILTNLRLLRDFHQDNTNLIYVHNHITRLINLHLIRNHGNVIIDSIGADNEAVINAFGDFDTKFLHKHIDFKNEDGNCVLKTKVTYNFLPIFSDQLDVVYVDNGGIDAVIKLNDSSFFTDHPEIYDGVLHVTLDGVMFYTVVDNKGATWLYRLDGMLAK